MEEIPFFSLNEQSKNLKENILRRISSCIDQSDFIQGKPIREFEKEFAQYCNAKHCLAVSSGTSALYVSLQALGIKPGDEIILPSATFISTALAVLSVGATLVFADIDPETWTIDPKVIKGLITNKTKAIIPVHLYGSVCNMNEILFISNEFGLTIVEDAAQAHGASYNGAKSGSIGNFGAFSFYPSKNLGAMGDAGAIVFNEDGFLETIQALRNVGKDNKGEHSFIGFNYRLSSFQGIVLSEKLKYLDRWNTKRNEIATFYKEHIINPKVSFQKVLENSYSAYHHFEIKTNNRQRFIDHSKKFFVNLGVHYHKPVHLQSALKRTDYRSSELVFTEALFSDCVSLPIYPEMPWEHVEKVVEMVNKY